MLLYSYPYDLSPYIRSLYSYIEQQNQRISQLEKILMNIQSEINEMKNTPKTHIDRIEYKFDQLKVETLEGTLNIGVNPVNGQETVNFAPSENNMNIPDIRHPYKNFIQEIHYELDAYLNNESTPYIHIMLKQKMTSLPDEHVQFILDDIRKQI